MEKMFGVYVATVLSKKPEKNMLMIKLDGFKKPIPARVAVPFVSADGNFGFFFLPKANDKVLVAFEDGDICSPIIIGSILQNFSSDMYDKIHIKSKEIHLN